jgi:hypothetical protein
MFRCTDNNFSQEIQRVFFPAVYFDYEPTARLEPGDTRIHVALKVFVEFSEATVLRVPTREPSKVCVLINDMPICSSVTDVRIKDWQYDGLGAVSAIDLSTRPYGWLNVAIGQNSSLNYVAPMIATDAGYDTLFELHLDTVEISTSVNYSELLKAGLCRVSCQMPSPLKWEDLHQWTFNVTLAQTEIYLLRDHITLLTDLIKDWVSGPPADYLHFVPYQYEINFNLVDYRLNLYLNDHNIIDNPMSVDENC